MCAHPNADHAVHEMLIAHLKGNYIPPHKHINKSESIHVINGTADLIFLDEKGEIIKVVPLGVSGSGRKFYCRVSTPLYHTLIVKSDIFVFQETTKGPYIRSETLFGEWAPQEDDLAAANSYMNELIERAKKFTDEGAEVC
jgi:cupin fold WbuC family metalloprotein